MTNPGLRPLRCLLPAIALAGLLAGCGSTLPGATAADDIRGNLGPDFLWAVREPTAALGPVDPDAARSAVDRAGAVIDPARDAGFGITIVATFDTAEQAAAHAEDVRDILEASAAWYEDPANAEARAALDDPDEPAPLTPPEAAAMKANLLAPGERGVGWGGEPGTADDAVYTIGPILVVTGLESDSIGSDIDPPLHPLAHLLAATGADVLLEGDRFGEGSIVADITCQSGDAARGVALRDEIGDAIITGGQFSTRPPWVGPPPTADEALARATYRRWVAGVTAAAQDPRIHDLAMRIANATDEEEREAATREYGEYMLQRGLSNIEGELDPTILGLLVDPPGIDDAAAYEAWTRKIGERMGRVPVTSTEYGDRPSGDDYAQLGITGNLRLNGDRLELAWLSFGAFAAGMPYLAAYLVEHGCDEVRVGTVDFDLVRGD